MNKISLKNLNLKEVEQLSREQLRNVLGGFTGSSDEGKDEGTEETWMKCNCSMSSHCPEDTPECAAGCDTNGTNHYGHCVARQ